MVTRPNASRFVVVTGFEPPAPHVADARSENPALTQYVFAFSDVRLYGLPPSARSNVCRLECFDPTTCCGRPKGSKHMRWVPGADDGRAVTTNAVAKVQPVVSVFEYASEVESATHSEAKLVCPAPS